jgi:hypothetical protein
MSKNIKFENRFIEPIQKENQIYTVKKSVNFNKGEILNCLDKSDKQFGKIEILDIGEFDNFLFCMDKADMTFMKLKDKKDFLTGYDRQYATKKELGFINRNAIDSYFKNYFGKPYLPDGDLNDRVGYLIKFKYLG